MTHVNVMYHVDFVFERLAMSLALQYTTKQQCLSWMTWMACRGNFITPLGNPGITPAFIAFFCLNLIKMPIQKPNITILEFDLLFFFSNHMGASLNGGTPQTPQNDHF